MTKPNECKWCGAEKIISPRPNMIDFGCWTRYVVASGEWDQDAVCVERMAAQTKILRDRIRQAVATLQAIQRHEVTPYTSRQVSWERTSDGPWILQRDVEVVVDDLVRVLEGET